MTNYNFGDVVLVPFPFTDQRGTKKRPAVIVSSNFYNVSLPDVVLMAITSQVKQKLKAGELEITEWQRAKLLKPSVIKPIFTTIERHLILRKLGKLENEDAQNLRNLLQNLMG